MAIQSYPRRRSIDEIVGLSRRAIYSMMSRGDLPRPVMPIWKDVA